MKKIKPLNYKSLRKTLNPKTLKFDTTDQISEFIDYLGQERALEAINLGIGIKSQGYNFFVMGPSGMGKRSLIRTVLKQFADTQPSPDDWCYIYNFEQPTQPTAIKLPPGQGIIFKNAMDDFVDYLQTSILSLYESDEYRLGLEEINSNFKRQHKLHKKRKKEELKLSRIYSYKFEAEKKLLTGLTKIVIDPHINKLQKKFSDFPKINAYLEAVKNHIHLHANDLVRIDPTTNVVTFDTENPALVRYRVNLLVNNNNRKGLPVIIEENPSYSNLISRIEYKMELGSLTTDFTLLRAGALHRANGGFLILDARKVKKNKNAWNSLKNALYSGKINIEPLEDNTESKPITLKPKPIPLKIKIVLVGDRRFYYHLSRKDPDFEELFKVAVDLDDEINRNEFTTSKYANLIGTLVQKRSLKPFDRTAVAAIIDYSSRLAEDTEKLSHNLSRINELVLESNYWAKDLGKKTVDAVAVQRAIEAKTNRLDRSRELYYEFIQRRYVLINTKSFAVGQLNCLSVVSVGNFSYGHPTRVTAKVRAGRGKVIDIQRNINLAGPIHSKAILTLTNYLASHYCMHVLFSLTASISFEQIYGSTDGDSASVAEICTLISAITDIPLNQALAVTGSINQYGEVQSIGGVNEKIEGFYDVCKEGGLTGNQGVVIPDTNIQNLMLREDIILACKNKKFSIYTISHVDEAIELLTGKIAGKRDKEGKFPANSVNAAVEKRLTDFNEQYAKRKT